MTIETLNADGGSGPWANPANAATSDNSYATVASKNNTEDFSLDDSAIVDADTVNTVTVKVEASFTGGGANFIDVGVLIGGILQGIIQRQAITTSDVVYTFTDATNWDIDWTAAQMDGMQIRIIAIQTGMPTAATWRVDHAFADIDFTLAPAGGTETPLHYHRMMR